MSTPTLMTPGAIEAAQGSNSSSSGGGGSSREPGAPAAPSEGGTARQALLSMLGVAAPPPTPAPAAPPEAPSQQGGAQGQMILNFLKTKGEPGPAEGAADGRNAKKEDALRCGAAGDSTPHVGLA
jgi:hypothetical protein